MLPRRIDAPSSPAPDGFSATVRLRMTVYNGSTATTTLCYEASKVTTSTTSVTAYYPAADIAAASARALAAARDRPQPPLDANRTAQKYAGMAQDFRASAWKHPEQGDLPQAPNKA